MNNNYILNGINKKYKYTYNVYECILKILDKNMFLLNHTDINIKSNNFKIKLANDLFIKNLYKVFDYDLKKQKNLIYTFLTSNHINVNINNNILKYICIYINLNILIIKNNLYRFVYEYNNNIETIILIEVNNRFIPYIYDYNNNYIAKFNDNNIKEIISLLNINYEIIIDEYVPFDTQFNKIKKLKLDEIYNICNHYNIELNKSNNIKKSKTVLLNELYNILKNMN